MKFSEGEVFEEFEAGGKKVTFRALKSSDLRGCLRHINTLIDGKAYISLDTEVTLAQEKEWLLKELGGNREGNKVTVVVETDGKISGMGSVWKGMHPVSSHKCDLAIGLNSGKGKGIGYRLMMTLERLAVERLEGEVMSFWVCGANVIARKLYAKCGYRQAGSIPRGCKLRGKYYDELIMVKDIG
ncbi:MAG: GNAT family N-acetyltransferase [Candidatus Aenigmatarchaeota archaeon]